MESAINDKIQNIYTALKPFVVRRGIAIMTELDQLNGSKLFKRMDMIFTVVFIYFIYKFKR